MPSWPMQRPNAVTPPGMGALRADNIERARQLIAAAENAPQPSREADGRRSR
jgi:hypothetical protein